MAKSSEGVRKIPQTQKFPAPWSRGSLLSMQVYPNVSPFVDSALIAQVAWFHHFTASWQNKCRYKYRNNDVVSNWLLRIVLRRMVLLPRSTLRLVPLFKTYRVETPESIGFTLSQTKKSPTAEAVGDSSLGQIQDLQGCPGTYLRLRL